MRSIEVLSQNIQGASIWFLEEKELYATIKPYSLAFPPAIHIPRENIERKEVPVNIFDLRGSEKTFNLDQNGFMVLNLPGEHPNLDWDNEKVVEDIHYPRVISELERSFPGSVYVPLCHKIRKQDPAFSMSTGQDYLYGQPLRAAHVDMTCSSAEQLIQEQVKDLDPEIFDHKYIVAKLWHPLKGLNEDWPLALCDLATMNPERDLEVADYHDSTQGETSGVPHAVFLNPYSKQEEPRESRDHYAYSFSGEKGFEQVGSGTWF